jgi:hypothetical protein
VVLEKAGRDQVDEWCKFGEELHRVMEKRNNPHTIKRRKAKWIGYTLRFNCFLKYIFEGKLEGLGR